MEIDFVSCGMSRFLQKAYAKGNILAPKDSKNKENTKPLFLGVITASCH